MLDYCAVKVAQTALAGKFCWKNDRKQVTLLNVEDGKVADSIQQELTP